MTENTEKDIENLINPKFIRQLQDSAELFNSLKFLNHPPKDALDTIVENVISKENPKKNIIPIGIKLSPGDIFILSRNENDDSIDYLEYKEGRVHLKRIHKEISLDIV